MKRFFTLLATFALLCAVGCGELPNVNDDPNNKPNIENPDDKPNDGDDDQKPDDGNDDDNQTPNPEEGHKIFVHNLFGWDPLYIYVWDKETLVEYAGRWCGTKMTERKSINGYEYLVYELPAEAVGREIGVIFNDGKGNQTPDWFITFDKSCYMLLRYTYPVVIQDENHPTENDYSHLDQIPESHKLYYTSTDGATVTPASRSGFGANYVDTTYIPAENRGVVIFDGTITTIGERAFADIYNLRSITLPSSVTSVGQWAFQNCLGLESVTINSLLELGHLPFLWCHNLREFKGAYASDDGRCIIYDDVLTLFAPAGLSDYTIPQGVRAIGKSVFEDCYQQLSGVVIPEGVTSIGESAFQNCTLLARITLPNTLTSFGESAFLGCASLQSVTIPDQVATLPYGLFDGCHNLESVSLGTGVTSIGERAFTWCKNLTSICIPYGVTSVGQWAFQNCLELDSVIFENCATKISYGAFSNCTKLAYVDLGNRTTSIGGGAFEQCTSLESITIPESVGFIGAGAFRKCTSLASATIGEGVTTIENEAFRGCTSLKSIAIPNSVTDMEQRMFEGCTSLVSATIGDNADEIEYDTFAGCVSLVSVTIGKKVRSIDSEAFEECAKLSRVYCKPITVPSIYNSFDDCDLSTLKIYVPTESLEVYKADYYWSEYADNIVGHNF